MTGNQSRHDGRTPKKAFELGRKVTASLGAASSGIDSGPRWSAVDTASIQALAAGHGRTSDGADGLGTRGLRDRIALV
jgi:hypothetical protein